MNREDCKKLLDSYEIIVSAEVNLGSSTAEGLNLEIAHDYLGEVILGIMEDGKKPTYRYTVSPNVTDYKPIVTCNGSTLAE